MNAIDGIDLLLQQKVSENNKRKSRSFYMDDDVFQVLDSLKSGVKSDVVNDALRRLFKDKGLL